MTDPFEIRVRRDVNIKTWRSPRDQLPREQPSRARAASSFPVDPYRDKLVEERGTFLYLIGGSIEPSMRLHWLKLLQVSLLECFAACTLFTQAR